MKFSLNKLGAAAATTIAATTAMAVFASSAFGAVNAGTLTVAVAGGVTPLNGTFDGASGFSLVLPTGATCQVGSGSGGRVLPYLISSTATISNFVPSALQGFTQTAPANPIVTSLYDAAGSPIIVNSGAISGSTQGLAAANLPVSFVLSNTTTITTPLDAVPAGSYNIGVACTDNARNVTDYWQWPITITAGGTGASGFQYAVSNTTANTPEVPLPVALPLAGIAVIGGGTMVRRRRKSRFTVAA
jgi:hypothetical protein